MSLALSSPTDLIGHRPANSQGSLTCGVLLVTEQMGYNSLALLQTLLRSKLLLEKTAMQTFTCSRRQDFHNYGDSFTEDLAGIVHPKTKVVKVIISKYVFFFTVFFPYNKSQAGPKHH